MTIIYWGTRPEVMQRIERTMQSLERTCEFQVDIRRSGKQWKGTLFMHHSRYES
jgi:hypothetical protein